MLTQEPKSNLGDAHPAMARCRGLLWAWEQEAGRAEVCGPHPPAPAPTRLPSAARGAHGKRAIFLLASEPLLSVDSRRRPLEGVNRVLNLFLNFIMQFIKFSV